MSNTFLYFRLLHEFYSVAIRSCVSGLARIFKLFSSLEVDPPSVSFLAAGYLLNYSRARLTSTRYNPRNAG